ncbi:hypothetical protein KDH_66580 [Dictyobacter sp. S3.2.2.5]|uniref:Uncharacterized protein n=1 Tax=Dictyobacter halimunensis TaxID=3026934 RepID=A0ABQ6FZZ4_9CHLR|nr:hypothetical protein KDH_66580 [Dictyobacter sp. S3.2.2.5]
MQQNTLRSSGDPRPEMVQALERAIELSVGRKPYTLVDGRLIYEQHRRYRYTFTLESSWDLPDGTDFQLQSADFDHLLVELSNTKDDRVTITTTQRLPDRTLSCARLVIERAYLLRKMKEVLAQLHASTGLGLKLFGYRDCIEEIAASSLIDVISDVFVPDDAQRLAIQRALGSEVQMILGPGGTGKTDVLAAIAMLHAVLYRRRVLIASHTNIAIDNAIIRLSAFFRKHGMGFFLNEQNLVRAGSPHLAELETDAYRHVTLSLIVNDAIEQQRDEIARLERRRKKMLSDIVTHEEALPEQTRAWNQRQKEIIQQRKRVQRELEDLEAEEQRRQIPIVERLSALEQCDTEAIEAMKAADMSYEVDEVQLELLQKRYDKQLPFYEEAWKELIRLREYPPVARFFVQLFTGVWEKPLEASVQDLAAPLCTLQDQMDPLQKRLAKAAQAYEQAEKLHNKLQVSITLWTGKRDTQPTSYLQEKAALARELKDLEHELETGNAHLAALEQELVKARQKRDVIEDGLAHLDQHAEVAKREVARFVLESAQVVGTTLTGLYLNSTLLNQQWDVVIIDEGSMAPPPAVMIAAQCARDHVIVVGDPLQLAPVCKIRDPNVPRWQHDQDLVQRWLGRDVFYHGGYTLQQAGSGTHHCVLLPYQSRMHSDICDLVRGLVYQGLLKDRHPATPRPMFGPEPDHPVVLYDTGGNERALALKPDSGRSRYNPYHAGVAIKLAGRALADIPDKRPECIGIVTPYAAQRDYIKELIRGTVLETCARVGTVHAFQGLEFDVLIFDTVESPGIRISRFTSDRWGTDAMRLFNVAVTRARHKLLIVANMAYIRREPASHLLPQMMELACQKKCVPAEALEA